MKEKGRIVRNFFFASFVLLLLSWVLFIFPFWKMAGADILQGLFLGSLSNFAVAFLYFIGVVWSFDRSGKAFLISLFGGMLAKMAVLASILVILLLILETNILWFILSFMLYYLAFQILEVIFFVSYFGRLRKGTDAGSR